MNISFHYFAVKYMAKRAGFTEDESQMIAEYSQFIDDCTSEIIVEVEESDLPEDMISRQLFRIESNGLEIVIPKTNALYMNETPDIDEWKRDISSHETQAYFLIPFHYIPRGRYGIDDIRRSDEDKNQINHKLRVDEIEELDNHPLFSKLLAQTTEQFSRPDSDRTECLIRLGILCHILADSYSHCLFSGASHAANDVKVREVRNCSTKSDLTKKYSSSKLDNLPMVGHLRAGRVLDDFGVMGGLSRQLTGGYTFNNIEKAENAAAMIMRMFCRCRGEEENLAFETKVRNIKEKLKDILAPCDTAVTDVNVNPFSRDYINELKSHWTGKTGHLFSYDKQTIRERLLSTYDEHGTLHELCRFNIAVDDVQQAIVRL